MPGSGGAGIYNGPTGGAYGTGKAYTLYKNASTGGITS